MNYRRRKISHFQVVKRLLACQQQQSQNACSFCLAGTPFLFLNQHLLLQIFIVTDLSDELQWSVWTFGYFAVTRLQINFGAIFLLHFFLKSGSVYNLWEGTDLWFYIAHPVQPEKCHLFCFSECTSASQDQKDKVQFILPYIFDISLWLSSLFTCCSHNLTLYCKE